MEPPCCRVKDMHTRTTQRSMSSPRETSVVCGLQTVLREKTKSWSWWPWRSVHCLKHILAVCYIIHNCKLHNCKLEALFRKKEFVKFLIMIKTFRLMLLGYPVTGFFTPYFGNGKMPNIVPKRDSALIWQIIMTKLRLHMGKPENKLAQEEWSTYILVQNINSCSLSFLKC